jgi:hypothetical protein
MHLETASFSTSIMASACARSRVQGPISTAMAMGSFLYIHCAYLALRCKLFLKGPHAVCLLIYMLRQQSGSCNDAKPIRQHIKFNNNRTVMSGFYQGRLNYSCVKGRTTFLKINFLIIFHLFRTFVSGIHSVCETAF